MQRRLRSIVDWIVSAFARIAYLLQYSPHIRYSGFLLSHIQARKDELYLLSLAVECCLKLAKLVSYQTDHVNSGNEAEAEEDEEEEQEKEQDDGGNTASRIPVLTLTHVSTLLAPLLRQTVLVRFPTVACAPISSNQPRNSSAIDSSEYSTSSSATSLLYFPDRPVKIEADIDWAHVHATEAPAVRTWWLAIARRLPNDKTFVSAGGADLAAAGGEAFDVPGVRRQIDGLLLSAEAMSKHAFNLRFSAEYECRRAAQLSATLCGMCCFLRICA